VIVDDYQLFDDKLDEWPGIPATIASAACSGEQIPRTPQTKEHCDKDL
jgi:hypothetical protein